jgi:hypothetical protein
MPNLTYSIHETPSGGGRTAVIGIRAIQTELAQFVKDVITEAAEDGKRTAEALAPRNKWNPGRNPKDSISRNIDTSDRSYAPGGTGGGGQYQVELYAESPHLREVMEGTGHYAGKGNIKPTHGNLLRFEGKGQKFAVREVKGQAPQTEWWERAIEDTERYIESRVDQIDLGHK